MTRSTRWIIPLLLPLVLLSTATEYLRSRGLISPLQGDLFGSLAPLILVGSGAWLARLYRLPAAVKISLLLTFLLMLLNRIVDIGEEMTIAGRPLLDGQRPAVALFQVFSRHSAYGMFLATILFALNSLRRVIGELERNREHAAASSRMLQAVLDTIPVRVFWKNKDLRYLGSNQLFAIDAGKQVPEDLVGLNDYDLVGPEEARRYRNDDTSVLKGEAVKRNYEQEHIRPDGSILWQRASKIPLRDSHGEIVGVLGLYEDITSEKMSQVELRRYQEQLEDLVQERSAALRRSEERYARAATAGRVGIWEYEFASGAVFVTNDFKALMGFSDEELPSTTEALMRRGHPEDNEMLIEAVRRYMRGQQDRLEFEHRALHRDGGWRWFQLTGELECDAAGRPVRLMGVDVDITQRKAAEQALRRAKEQAEAAARAKADFLANMSHEIRTPMNGVMGMAHLLLAAGLPPEQHRRVEIIVQSGESLLSVINDILDFSKIDAGEMQIDVVPMDFRELVQRTVAPHLAAAGQKSLQLSVEIDPALPRLVLGDPLRIGQVLSNLLNNAVKFTNQGNIRLVLSGDGEKGGVALIRMRVQDTGIGIAEDRIGAIFDKFSQADSSTTRRFGGSGLGLTICQRLVELMGGEIHVESRVGDGSTFAVTLPLEVAEQCRPASHVPAQVPDDSPQFAILLAEDNLLNLEVARDFLSPFAQRLDVAMNGQDAIELARARAYDLIFMDLHMPEIDGLSATRTIRTLPGHAKTPIIAMTASVLDEDRQRCAEAGMSDFLPKPLQPRDVVDVIVRNTN